MNFVESVESFFKKYTIIHGRSSRSEFWYVMLFFLLITIPLDFIEMILLNKEYSDPMILSSIFSLITLIPFITLTARRLHDVNMSGWWQLIPITIIGIIPYIYWLVKKSDDTNNKYGSNPLKNYEKLDGRVALNRYKIINYLLEDSMFNDLFNFQKERLPVQALGFYIVFLLGGFVIGGISGVIFATDVDTSFIVGQVVSVVYCLFLGFLILLQKDQLNTPFAAFLFVIAILSYFFGALGGLIPVAYLSTVKNLKSDL